MTKLEVIAYIEKDIVKLRKERKKATPKNAVSCTNETLRNYLATRENTLMEILNLLTGNKKPFPKPKGNDIEPFGVPK